MDRMLARLERRFGRFAIENLTNYLVGGMALVFVLMMARPEFLFALVLDMPSVLHGQVWRLVTFLFLPPPWANDIWFLFDLYIFWMIGSNLEREWGAFKFNVYYAVGAIATIAAAAITGRAEGNIFLIASLALAFATLFPRFEIAIFFILPVQVRWLGWLVAAFLAYECVIGDWGTRAAIVAAFANYLLFFWSTIVGTLRGQRTQWKQEARRQSFRPPPNVPIAQSRACAICGAKEEDGADIRVCSCEKCKAATGGAARTLCLEHARNH